MEPQCRQNMKGVLVVVEGARLSSEHCRDTAEQGTKPTKGDKQSLRGLIFFFFLTLPVGQSVIFQVKIFSVMVMSKICRSVYRHVKKKKKNTAKQQMMYNSERHSHALT